MSKLKYPNIDTEYDGIGVYAIRNKKNGKMYIGSSVDVKNRVQAHRTRLMSSSINLKTLKDIHGPRALKQIEVIILKKFAPGTITASQLLNAERDYIIKYDTIENGYNTRLPLPCRPYNDSELLEGSRRKETEQITILAPRGTVDRIKAIIGPQSVNSYVNDLIAADIKRREDPQETAEKAAPQETPQAATPAARTNTREGNESPAEGPQDAREKPRKARRTGPAARQKIGNEGPDARKDLHPIKAGDAAAAAAEDPDEDAPGWLPFS